MIDKYIGITKSRHYIYECHCTKCNQYLILSTDMLTDKRVKLCYCEFYNTSYNPSYNLGKYSKKKYKFDIHDPKIKPLFDKWVAMRQRCNNPNNNNYIYYGGRGIKVCKEWDNNLNGFLNFYSWAITNGWKTNNNLSIDHINVNIGYEPNNCRWANREIQNSNQSSNRFIQYNTYIFSINIWAKIIGIDYYKLYMRIRNGWSFEKSIFTNTNFSKSDLNNISEEFEVFNKYKEWVNIGKIEPIESIPKDKLPLIKIFNKYE